MASRRAISCSSVTSTRAPEAPIGWPIAIAPPLTLTLAGSQPRSLLTAIAWAANASLASTRSRSLTDQPARSSALREAGIGPVPMIAGSTPAVAQETMRASGVMPRRLRFGGRHHHQRRRAVVDARGVAGRHRAVLGEGGPQLGDGFVGRAGADVLVVGDDDVALAARDGHRDDLVLEPAGLLRRLGLVLRSDGEIVLLLAADLPLGGDVLGGGAHVITVEGVHQPVLDHGVDELHLAHLHAVAQMRGVRRERHRFLAAGDDDLGVAVDDLLQAERDGAQAASRRPG